MEKIYPIFIGFHWKRNESRDKDCPNVYGCIPTSYSDGLSIRYLFDVVGNPKYFYIGKYLFAKLKPKIRAIIVNVQTVPQKHNELLSLITRLKKTIFIKRKPIRREVTEITIRFFRKNQKKKITPEKKNAAVITTAEKTNGTRDEKGEYLIPFFKKKTMNPFVIFAAKKEIFLRII